MEAATTPRSTALEPASYVEDLVLVPSPGQTGPILALSPAARARFSQASIYLLAQKYAKSIRSGADAQAFMGLLEVATELDLNPLTNEVWLVKFNQVWVPMVGRDGFNTVAHRSNDVIGVTGDIHREKDEFWKEFDSETGWKVHHRTVGGNKARGPILGAWALLKKREGHDVFFYADRETYDKAGGQHKSAWDTHPDAMILKVPWSYVCRIGAGRKASGALPADEIALDLQPGDVIEGQVLTGNDSEPTAPTPKLPDDLRDLLNRAHAIDAVRWNPHKVLGRIPVEPDAVAPVIEEIRTEVTAWLADNEIQDADVVKDDDSESAEDVPDDTPAEPSLQDRYEGDEKWRKQVDRYLGSAVDLEAALESADGEAATQIASQLAEVQDQLRKLGVPHDWQPAQAGQTALPL